MQRPIFLLGYCRVSRASSKIADIGSMQPSFMREFFLRPAFRLAQLAHVHTEAGTDFHAAKDGACRQCVYRRSVTFPLTASGMGALRVSLIVYNRGRVGIGQRVASFETGRSHRTIRAWRPGAGGRITATHHCRCVSSMRCFLLGFDTQARRIRKHEEGGREFVRLHWLDPFCLIARGKRFWRAPAS